MQQIITQFSVQLLENDITGQKLKKYPEVTQLDTMDIEKNAC